MNWNYPTSIWFGEKRINEIQKACESLNIKKPLIVTDPGILKTNILKAREIWRTFFLLMKLQKYLKLKTKL